MILHLQLTFDNINISAQVGDIVYYTVNNNPTGGFDQLDLLNTKLMGTILLINGNTITVEVNTNLTSQPPSNPSPFYSFAKNKLVNTSSLLGYYAQVDFVNDATQKAELFSVGSEVVESSK